MSANTTVRGYVIYLNQGRVGFVTETCCNCGIPFALLESHYEQLSADGGGFYCPNGHLQCYTETEAKRLRRQLEAEQQVSAEARRRAQQEREARKHAEKVAQGYKGQMVRTQNRVSNGVCPCCNRSFANVKRHMTTQHPEYVLS
jgi:hypothetical protein